MINTHISGGMQYGYYWVKEQDDSDWEVVYYNGSHFIWFGICHGNEDWTMEPSLVYKFNATKLMSPE